MADTKRSYGSVQELLPLEDIHGDILCLRGGEYRAVLEAGSVNFALKSETEQETILAGYRSLLNSLTFPIQILVRIVPTDVERYLAALRCEQAPSATLARLALDHEAFVRRLARQRTLLERRFYVVVPSGTQPWPGPRSVLPWRTRARTRLDQTLAAATPQLILRCDDLMQRLAGLRVPARRLTGEDLAALCYAMLTSDLARIQPLARSPWPVVITGRSDQEATNGD
jgi:hypothetical protein